MRHAHASSIGVLGIWALRVGSRTTCRAGGVASCVQLLSTTSATRPQDEFESIPTSRSARLLSISDSGSTASTYLSRSAAYNLHAPPEVGARALRPDTITTLQAPTQPPVTASFPASEKSRRKRQYFKAKFIWRFRRRPNRNVRPSQPRLGVSVLVISPQNRVLLLHYSKHSTTHRAQSRSHPFLPGGRSSSFHDGPPPAPDHPNRHMDDEVYRRAAIREIFCKVGILLARDPNTGRIADLTEQEREDGRRDIVDNKVSFRQWLANRGITPDTDSLLPFTRWITAPWFPRRVSTQMYIYFLPTLTKQASDVAVAAETDPINVPPPRRAPQRKYVVARFLPASKWLNLSQKRRVRLEMPHFFLFHQIAQHLDALETPTAYETVSWDPQLPEELEARRKSLLEFITQPGDPAWKDKRISMTRLDRVYSTVPTRHERRILAGEFARQDSEPEDEQEQRLEQQQARELSDQTTESRTSQTSEQHQDDQVVRDRASSDGSVDDAQDEASAAHSQSEEAIAYKRALALLAKKRSYDGELIVHLRRRSSIRPNAMFELSSTKPDGRLDRDSGIADQYLALKARRRIPGRGKLAVVSTEMLVNPDLQQLPVEPEQIAAQEKRDRNTRRWSTFMGGTGFGRGGRFY